MCAGGLLKTKIEDQVQRIFRARKAGTDHESLDAYAADAVAEFLLAETVEVTEAPTPSVPNAYVHIVADHGALIRGGTAEGEVCEIPGVGPVNVAWVKELLGSAFLTLVIKKGKDILTVAHLGRHVPAEVMTALIVGGRECDVEGCNHRGYLERDHVDDHATGWTDVVRESRLALLPAPPTQDRGLDPPTRRPAHPKTHVAGTTGRKHADDQRRRTTGGHP